MPISAAACNLPGADGASYGGGTSIVVSHNSPNGGLSAGVVIGCRADACDDDSPIGTYTASEIVVTWAAQPGSVCTLTVATDVDDARSYTHDQSAVATTGPEDIDMQATLFHTMLSLDHS